MAGSLTYVFGILPCLLLACAEASRPYYTAAVFEHARFGSENDSAALVVKTNLEYYRKAANTAKSKGADLILFPEYGIFPPGNRIQLKKFLEYIPDPTKERINPCEQRDEYKDRPILYSLSCMAKDNSMVVVANTGDIQNCTGDDTCQLDGVFHYNTNVAFDRDGTLLVKYYKEHLYFEFGMNLPKKQQDSTFHTDFGTFATYICFDITFPRMGAVGRWSKVDAILFSTMWFDAFPQYVSIQFWQSWALGNDVTLLASNIHHPHYFSIGSGMFNGQSGALAYTFNPDGISKLVVANVPKRGFPPVAPNASITAISSTGEWEVKDVDRDVPKDCARNLVGDKIGHYRCLEERLEDYSFVKLSDPSGHVETCNNGMCCSIDYSTNGFGGERFFLGVFNGTFNSMDRYFFCEENCVLSRCDANEDSPCSVFPLKSSTVFKRVYLRANFTTDFVYPQVVASGMKLVPLSDWHQQSVDYYHPFDHSPNYADTRLGIKSIYFENAPGKSLISVGIKGRCYERDPPYKQ